MKKITVLWIILDLIFLVIFNLIFFIFCGTEHKISVWISYAFIHFAYLMLLLTPKLIRKGKSSAVFGFSLYSISAVYFLIEFITGIIFIWVSQESFTASFLVQLCIAGLYSIVLISHLIANEHTANTEEKRQYQIAYIKDASIKLKSLLENINDKETKKIVEKIYDAIYSSPAKSHVDLAQIENRILQSIKELEITVSLNNKERIVPLANMLLSDVNERNMRLKNLN
jgi:hypothetical protein